MSKEEAMQATIDAQAKTIKDLQKGLHAQMKENLKVRMHMQVLCSHPVGLASKMIAKKYSRDIVTRELQRASQN